MYRDVDTRPHEPEQPDLSRGGRVGGETERMRPESDSRDVFLRDLALPRGPERERVRVRSREYRLRGSEARVMATVGALRVVDVEDLRRGPDDVASRIRHDVEHLRSSGLMDARATLVDDRRTIVVTLTREGRDLLEHGRVARGEHGRQAYHMGPPTLRELQHDIKVHVAYRAAAERLISGGARLRRVVLERELKREYQRFLHEPAAHRGRRSGRGERSIEEIARWAAEHRLPTHDGHVQFPDVRIEYEQPDGRFDVQDLEVVTPHYRGAHAAAKARSGFHAYRAAGARLSGRHASSRAGRDIRRGPAEDLLS